MKGLSNTVNKIKTDITNISLQMLYGKNLDEIFKEIKEKGIDIDETTL